MFCHKVMLYDTNRRLLDSRFLKKNEVVHSGESLAFESHLVEIGEQEDHKLPIDLTLPEKNHKIVGKNISDIQAEISCNEKFHAGISLSTIFIEVRILVNLTDHKSWRNVFPVQSKNNSIFELLA